MSKILYFLTLIFFLSALNSCNSTLTPQEIQQVKKDQDFWQWSSSYGTFDIHYVEKGSGSNHVVLIHGFGSNTYTWKYLIKPLVDAGYHVWALDLLGYGLSDKPLNAPYGLDLFVAQINAFMEGKQIHQAHLIGNSMGGGLALGTAIGNPNKIKSLILIDAFGYPMNLPPYLEIGKMLGPLSQPFTGRFLVKQILNQVMRDPNKVTEEQIEAYTLPLQMPGGPEAFNATLQNFNEKQIIELGKHYNQLRMPILVIWGEKDTWIPLSHYEHFLKDFPQAEGIIIPNCGHILEEECPQEVISATINFLNKI